MTLRLWIFSILPAVSLAASSASVYLSPSSAFGSSVQATEELSASQAELLLTHHLGLDTASPLDENDVWWNSAIEQAGGQGVLGQELMSSMTRDAVVVVVEANSEDLHGDHTLANSHKPFGLMPFADLLPNSLHEPTFRFHADASSLDALVTTYAARASYAYSSVSSSANAPSYKEGSLGPGTLGLYDLAATSPAAEAFMSEFSALAEFGEGMRDVSDTAFGAFVVHSLPALKAEFGHDSQEYKTAVLALRAALTSVSFLPVGRLFIGLNLVIRTPSGPQTWLSSSSIPRNLLTPVARRSMLPPPNPPKPLSQPSRPETRLFTLGASAILPQNLV